MLTSDEQINENADSDLVVQLSAKRSRRSMLRGALIGAAGVTGVAAVGAGALTILPRGVSSAHAASAIAASATAKCSDSIQTILNVAATAEQLAVTFYSNGIANAMKLGIKGVNLDYLQEAVVEEQLHENYLVSAGGVSTTSTFSFPDAGDTFKDLNKFVMTLDMLESAFESAYIAAIKEFADMNQSSLAVLAGQIATIEGEHRAVGRTLISTQRFPNNQAFTPVYVKSVSDAVNLLTNEGFLSPTSGNSYSYSPVSTDDKNVHWKYPYTDNLCS
jgi:hypothetical protein